MTAEEGKAFVLFRTRIAEATMPGGRHPFLFDTLSLLEATRVRDAIDGVLEAHGHLRAEVTAARLWLWLSHGCPPGMLYGDDGEMQCHAPGCGVDFLRWPLIEILHRVVGVRPPRD